MSAAQSGSTDLNLPDGAFVQNVQVVGYSELDGRPGFKLDIQQVGDRWYLYMGHLWHRGWTIADVTDPANPEVLKYIPGPNNTWTKAIAEDCNEPLNHASVVDISNPAEPVLLATMPKPVPPAGSPWMDFCDKGGRFGPHNIHMQYANPYVEHRDDRIYLTYFNAGLRILDIADPRQPVEIGYLPPEPTQRNGVLPKTLTSQAEDVLVDGRGYIYITDKNQGLWVLRYVEA